MRSSHMNQNRCWPGVPNRYSTRPASSVTRPKSMATVVVVLSGVCDRSSTPSLTDVITASVVSGVISETDPTNVVLPAPKPPATTIFTDVTAASVSTPEAALESAKSTKHPFKEVEIWPAGSVLRLVDPDESVRRHVPYQDTRDAERHTQDCGDLSYRSPVTAEPEYRLTFRAQRREVVRLVMRRRDHGLDLQMVVGSGPASSNRVGTDESTRLLLLKAEFRHGVRHAVIETVGVA